MTLQIASSTRIHRRLRRRCSGHFGNTAVTFMA
jgi:hypothetical protein